MLKMKNEVPTRMETPNPFSESDAYFALRTITDNQIETHWHNFCLILNNTVISAQALRVVDLTKRDGCGCSVLLFSVPFIDKYSFESYN